MIITISGTPGSGKTTLAEFLAKKLNLRIYLVGELVRKIAEKKGLSIIELDKKAVNDKGIDREIDKIHAKLKGKDNFVMDSRVAFKFFPDSLKIFLYCKPEIAAKRIFKSKRKTEEMGFKEPLKELEQRNKLDVIRYKRYYCIDIDNPKNYDLIVDTSKMNMEQMKNTAFSAISRFLKF